MRVVLSSGNFTATFLLHNNRKTYKHVINGNCNCILFTKLPWTGDSKRIFQFASQAPNSPSTHLSTTHSGEGFTQSLFIAKLPSRKIVLTNFYGLWFHPTGNRTRVYHFRSKRFIHSITDWLNFKLGQLKANT